MMKALVLLATSIGFLLDPVPSHSGPTNCEAQLEFIDDPTNDCPGCTHDFVFGSLDSPDCEDPCYFWYDLYTYCFPNQAHTSEDYYADCGAPGGSRSFDCGPGTPAYAAIRIYCDPCED